MSRPPLARGPVRAVVALTVGAASLVGLGPASAAPPVTYAVTGVSPAFVEADVDDAFGITLTGKGFTRRTRVTFSDCGATPTGTVVAPATATATKLVVKPPRCPAGLKDITVTEGSASTPTSTLARRLTFLATPEVAVPADPTVPAVTPAAGSWTGGTLASLRLVDELPPKSAVQVRFTSGGVTRAVAAKGDTTDLRKLSFKVPPGLPGASPAIAVSVFGILSEPVEAHFRYLSTIEVSPAAWVRGAAAPVLKVDGAGFSGSPTVTVCGEAATPVVGKSATAKTLYVTPPAWSTVMPSAAAQDAGTVCTVQVTTGSVTSVVTAGSTFTYAVQ